ncbi:hypothetical protein Acr_08g0011720 [Actinidia rufa]|uniref:Uncharacterized protein n=1 Tax=Actinidia rufa TaxID=165716 RepID=A0A7J0F2Z6_9ERIC|nr:hypothetical protein Acr_08g0011720 [Actinidia rufa]
MLRFTIAIDVQSNANPTVLRVNLFVNCCCKVKMEKWLFCISFYPVATSLYCLKLMLLHYLTEAIGVGLVLAFTSFLVYEQYEAEVDGIMKILLIVMKQATGLLKNNLPVTVTSFLHNSETLDENGRPDMEKDRLLTG